VSNVIAMATETAATVVQNTMNHGVRTRLLKSRRFMARSMLVTRAS